MREDPWLFRFGFHVSARKLEPEVIIFHDRAASNIVPRYRSSSTRRVVHQYPSIGGRRIVVEEIFNPAPVPPPDRLLRYVVPAAGDAGGDPLDSHVRTRQPEEVEVEPIADGLHASDPIQEKVAR